MLKQFLKIAMKRKKIVFFSAAVPALLSALYSFLAPPVYQATAQISIDEGAVRTSLSDNVGAWQKYVGQQRQFLKSKDLLSAVIDKLHLGLSRRFMAHDPAAVLERYITIRHIKGTNLVNIVVRIDRPELASRIAVTLAEEYALRSEQRQIALTEKALSWLREASEVSQRIKNSQEALSNFIKQNKLEFLNEDLDATKKILDLLTTQKKNEELDAGKLLNDIKELEMPLEKKDIDQVASVLKEDTIITSLRQESAEKELKIGTLRRTYEESHPQIERLKKDIEEIDNDIYKRADEVLDRGKEDIETARRHIEDLDKESILQKEKLLGLEDAKRQVDALARQAEANQRLYNEILSMLQDKTFSIVEVRGLGLLDEDVLTLPVAPKKARNITLGIAGGFILGVFISVFLEKERQVSQ